MTFLRFFFSAVTNIVLQYLTIVVAHASITTESIIGTLVAVFLQLTVISLVVRLHIRYWKP